MNMDPRHNGSHVKTKIACEGVIDPNPMVDKPIKSPTCSNYKWTSEAHSSYYLDVDVGLR